MTEPLEVDPAQLILPSSRSQGADPGKLAYQISRFGRSLAGMPPLQVVRDRDGRSRINDGVTRATRAAQLSPGSRVVVEVIAVIPGLDVARTPQVKDMLP